MSDSIRSEHEQEPEVPRINTADSDLDDHRFQPQSLPRHDSVSHPRRNTRRATGLENGRFLNVDNVPFRTTVRDFENAIDDDASDRGSNSFSRDRRPSAAQSPISARRNTFRRARNLEDLPSRARDESRSTVRTARTVSPPNSVEAFEPRRRGRANTFTSIAPSHMSLDRCPSAGTHPRGRTFSEDHGTGAALPDGQADEPVEDDVCFPAEEDVYDASWSVDFSALDNFVANKPPTKTPISTPVPHPFGSKQTLTDHATRSQIFHDLNKKASHGKLPKVVELPDSPHVTFEASIPEESDETIVSEKGAQEDELIGERKWIRPYDRMNRWSFFSSELEETIHAPELGDLLMPDETFQHLFELNPAGGVWWLDMLMPSEEEVDAVCKAFGIHGLTREDIIQQETREKVELFKSYYFVCFRSFYQMNKNSEYYLEPINVYAVVFREGMLTFTFCPSPHASNVRKRMSKLRDFVSLGSDWICYALIDDIVDSFGPVIRGVEREADAIEDAVFTARPEDSRALLRQIGECRKTTMSLLRLLGGKADVIKGFAKRCNEQYDVAPRQDVGLYLSDIQDHVVTMMQSLGHYEKMLSRSHSNYLAQISVDNIAQGARANEVLGKVTFIATVLVPMNLVCGLFGMNVDVPGKNADGLGWFFGILGSLLCFFLISFFVAKRLRFF